MVGVRVCSVVGRRRDHRFYDALDGGGGAAGRARPAPPRPAAPSGGRGRELITFCCVEESWSGGQVRRYAVAPGQYVRELRRRTNFTRPARACSSCLYWYLRPPPPPPPLDPFHGREKVKKKIVWRCRYIKERYLVRVGAVVASVKELFGFPNFAIRVFERHNTKSAGEKRARRNSRQSL